MKAGKVKGGCKQIRPFVLQLFLHCPITVRSRLTSTDSPVFVTSCTFMPFPSYFPSHKISSLPDLPYPTDVLFAHECLCLRKMKSRLPQKTLSAQGSHRHRHRTSRPVMDATLSRLLYLTRHLKNWQRSGAMVS